MYNKKFKGDVCGHSISFLLDNFFRRILQNPKKIVGEYIRKGDIVIDLGCGPGFFSIAMAKMVGKTGKVYCVDLQKEMLETVKSKAEKNNLTGQMILHNCTQDNIGLNEDVRADFIFAYYMLHETPDPISFAKQIKPLLKGNGKFLIVEPFFHVTKTEFGAICEGMTSIGFSILDTPKNKGGRSLLLTL